MTVMRPSRPARAALLGTCFLSLIACSQAASTGREEVGAKASAIQGGVEDENDPAVVGIISGTGMCTGSLIAPNLVLTAQHCVAAIDSPYVECETSRFGDIDQVWSISVTTQWDGLSRYFRGDHVKFHHAVEVMLPPGDDEVCGRDVALIRLEGKGIPPTEALPLNPRVDSVVTSGEEYRAVGYGSTSASGGGAGLRRMRDQLVVKCSGDCLTSSIVEEKEWIGETGICSGDSGGPALDLQGRVIGVVSRGSNWGDTCAMPVYGSVFGWADWIKEQAAVAAEKGGYEPAAWVTGGETLPETDAGALPSEPDGGALDGGEVDGGVLGAACSAPEDCISRVCATTAEPGYCTLGCSNLAPACPSGMACDLALGFCARQDLPGRCVSDEDCEGSATCDPQSGRCETGEAAGDAQLGGGCAAGGTSSGGAAAAGAIVLLGLVLRRRRRQA